MAVVLIVSDPIWKVRRREITRFIDGLVYTRGSEDDWNQWAEITGDDVLRWDNILPLMEKVSQQTKR